eukprot:GHVU01209521.1.p1 GENE.GHVU01209521.1~~GHVU01209521.1.p1  ORF type:complete len:122 (+),score=1.20 GHVU01209521.1:229-594(+)
MKAHPSLASSWESTPTSVASVSSMLSLHDVGARLPLLTEALSDPLPAPAAMTSVSWSPTGRAVATGDSEGAVNFYLAADASHILSVAAPAASSFTPPLEGSDFKQVTTLQWSCRNLGRDKQ